MESAKNALALTQKRQKMIRLADKSDAGWLVVEEYESDELAEDSEDDKKIRKAQNKASRKKKQLLQTKNKQQRTSSSNFNTVQSEDRPLFRGICIQGCR